MEDGLGPMLAVLSLSLILSLNPCCNGRWSRTVPDAELHPTTEVLILVVMEDGLGL